MQRNENESIIAYMERATQALSKGDISVKEWAEIVAGDGEVYSPETLRRCSNLFKMFLEQYHTLAKDGAPSEEKENLEQLLEEIRKEKIKVQTANLEYNANLRNDARQDMLSEKVVDAIERLEPFEFFNYPLKKEAGSACTAVLCIGDEHYGTVVNMKSLNGAINVYDPDIFKQRMNDLMNQICSDCLFMGWQNLVVFDLGDAIQGILRLSDLAKLKTGVIESTIEYAEFISEWLVELGRRLEIPIEYNCLGGNHCELRLINGRKGDFPDENMGRIIHKFVETRLSNNPYITVTPYAETIVKNIQGINILVHHGDDAKNDFSEINFWEDYHNMNIDILIMGHFHHFEQKSVGIGNNTEKEVIRCPSIIGADLFGKKCRKISKAGALMILFENGMKSWQKKYVLN